MNNKVTALVAYDRIFLIGDLPLGLKEVIFTRFELLAKYVAKHNLVLTNAADFRPLVY